GRPAPPELGEALRALGNFSGPARTQRAELVLQLLEPMADDQLDARIGRLCRRLEVALEEVGPPLKAARIVLRAAAAMDMGRESIAGDLAVLGVRDGDDLLDAYDKARAAVRAEVVQASLVAHGRVLMGVEWRIDTLGASNRGRKLNVPVARM